MPSVAVVPVKRRTCHHASLCLRVASTTAATLRHNTSSPCMFGKLSWSTRPRSDIASVGVRISCTTTSRTQHWRTDRGSFASEPSPCAESLSRSSKPASELSLGRRAPVFVAESVCIPVNPQSSSLALFNCVFLGIRKVRLVSARLLRQPRHGTSEQERQRLTSELRNRVSRSLPTSPHTNPCSVGHTERARLTNSSWCFALHELFHTHQSSWAIGNMLGFIPLLLSVTSSFCSGSLCRGTDTTDVPRQLGLCHFVTMHDE